MERATPPPASPAPPSRKRPHPDSPPPRPPPDSGLPYPHQVGGHGQLTKTRSGFLLKPSSDKEHAFYNYLSSHRIPAPLRWLRNVTPRYFGQQLLPPSDPVSTPPDSDSASAPAPAHSSPRPNLQTAPNSHHPLPNSHPDPASSSPPLPTGPPSTHIPPPLPETDIHLHDPNAPPDLYPRDFLASAHLPHPLSRAPPPPYPHLHAVRWRFNDAPHTLAADISPWAVQMDNRRKSRRKAHKRARPSIRLEDINVPFMLPCILDCKMGVRHYDDDASEEKRRRHMHKANTTTSAKCGVRYTGMQSFKRALLGGVFDVKDKYHGRTLAEKDLIPMATWFFHNDHELRTDCIELMLDKLKNLRPYVMAQHHFYFYSSSLLLVYEGASPDLAPPRVEVRMIDFAHTVLSNGKRDDGYLLGLDYMIGILTTILQNDKTGKTIMSPSISMAAAQKAAAAAAAASASAAAATIPTKKAAAQKVLRDELEHEGENGNCETAVSSAAAPVQNGHMQQMQIS